MRRLFAATVLFLLLAVVFPVAASPDFWASKGSNKYHYPTCKYAQKIKPTNLIKFSSPEKAVMAGYLPCTACNPPLASK